MNDPKRWVIAAVAVGAAALLLLLALRRPPPAPPVAPPPPGGGVSSPHDTPPPGPSESGLQVPADPRQKVDWIDQQYQRLLGLAKALDPQTDTAVRAFQGAVEADMGAMAEPRSGLSPEARERF